MRFNKGDIVKLLNSVEKAVVVEYIQNSTKVKIRVDDFYDQWIDEKELILAENNNKYNLNVANFENINKEEKPLIKKSKKALSREVDLHYENFKYYDNNIGDYEKLLSQIDKFKKALTNAIRDNINELIVIHGIGKGRLRAEIKRELDIKYPHLEHYDRDLSMGATVVVLRNK